MIEEDRHDDAVRPSADAHSQPNHAEQSFARELLHFLYHHKIWWLAPIMVVLALMVIVALLAGPVKVPFIYR
jgi:Family of unknown function (DUF5989)